MNSWDWDGPPCDYGTPLDALTHGHEDPSDDPGAHADDTDQEDEDQ